MKNRKVPCCFAAVCVFYAFIGYIVIQLHLFDSKLSDAIISNTIQTIELNINEHEVTDEWNKRRYRVIIGLGAQKSASTYFQQWLNITMQHMIHRKSFHDAYTADIKQELHYWDDCILNQYVSPTLYQLNEYVNFIHSKRLRHWTHAQCDFNHYLQLFGIATATNSSYDHNMTAVKITILSEKTPSYLRYYHSSYSLSFYAHLYDISFYVLLRNPVKRTWSMYWMYSRVHRQSISNSTDPQHIAAMSDKIENDIARFSANYPLFHQLLSMLEINASQQTNNDDLDPERVFQAYIKAVYDPYSKFDIPFLMIGCYYPQLVMWLHTFNHVIPNQWRFSEQKLLQHRLKVLQTETMLQDPKESMKQFVCWILGNEEQCQDVSRWLDGRSAALSVFRKTKLKRKRETYAPNSVDVLNVSVAASLQRFYQDCNQRLYWLLQEHPAFLLPTQSFPPW